MVIITFINLEHLKYKNKGFLTYCIYIHSLQLYILFNVFLNLYFSPIFNKRVIRSGEKKNKRNKTVSVVQLHSILAGDTLATYEREHCLLGGHEIEPLTSPCGWDRKGSLKSAFASLKITILLPKKQRKYVNINQ